jgi:aspartyl/asparaginyl beta-hydroxylase (cupin superfamily)
MELTEQQYRDMREIVTLAASLFNSEPTDAADFKDNSAKILNVWRAAKDFELSLDD